MDEADLDRFLDEDIGAGDITSLAVPLHHRVRGYVVAREACVVAGLEEASAVFARLCAQAMPLVEDGDEVSAGTRVLAVDGPARSVLTAERLALNFLMRMSGIATLTRETQRRVEAVNPRCRVAATRKTTPGFRRYEKRAVALGGGDPHRFGLDDAFLVKDNHFAGGLGVAEIVERCRRVDPSKFLQVEADRPEQALEAARAGADGVLLDNFSPDEARKTFAALKAMRESLLVECSGGITPESAPGYASACDRVSLSALTLRASAKDFGLDVEDAPAVDAS